MNQLVKMHCLPEGKPHSYRLIQSKSSLHLMEDGEEGGGGGGEPGGSSGDKAIYG